MTFEVFRETAINMLDDIPDEFLRDLQGVHVFEHTIAEPELNGVYRLGEYRHAGAPSFFSGNHMGSHIALFYGSFCQIANNNPRFNWEDQLWDTLTHELRHHVETLAGDASLVAEDNKRMAKFRRNNKHS